MSLYGVPLQSESCLYLTLSLVPKRCFEAGSFLPVFGTFSFRGFFCWDFLFWGFLFGLEMILRDLSHMVSFWGISTHIESCGFLVWALAPIFMIPTQFVDLVLQQLNLIQVSFLFGRAAGWMGVRCRRARVVDNQMRSLQYASVCLPGLPCKLSAQWHTVTAPPCFLV